MVMLKHGPFQGADSPSVYVWENLAPSEARMPTPPPNVTEGERCIKAPKQFDASPISQT